MKKRKIRGISKLLFLSICLICSAIVGGAAIEVAIPNPDILGKSLHMLVGKLVLGTKEAVMPESVEIEIINQTVQSITVKYPKTTPTNDLIALVSSYLSTKPRQMGNGVSAWRNEKENISGMLVVTKKEFSLMLRYIGKSKSSNDSK